MNSKLAAVFFLTFSISSLCGQEPIDVTRQTIKIGSGDEEKLYYAFEEGDKILFNFKEVKNKKLQEVEILEYPSNSKFSDFKAAGVKDKTLNVSKKGVYIFRFKNSAIGRRVCEIQVQRIPKSEGTKSFDTNVKWTTKQDTIWNTYTKDVIVGYDTIYNKGLKRELIETKQSEELILTKNQRVHSNTNPNGPKSYVSFTLPSNKVAAYKTEQVISWAYWIGVDEAGDRAWEQNVNAISTLIEGAASIYLTPLGALAIGAVTDLAIPSIGEDVSYWITDQDNANLFMRGEQFNLWDQGKGVAGYQKFTNPSLCQGTFYILLENDNILQGINANIKVVAITETSIYEDREHTEEIITPRTEKQILKEPIITSRRVPVFN